MYSSLATTRGVNAGGQAIECDQRGVPPIAAVMSGRMPGRSARLGLRGPARPAGGFFGRLGLAASRSSISTRNAPARPSRWRAAGDHHEAGDHDPDPEQDGHRNAPDHPVPASGTSRARSGPVRSQMKYIIPHVAVVEAPRDIAGDEQQDDHPDQVEDRFVQEERVEAGRVDRVRVEVGPWRDAVVGVDRDAPRQGGGRSVQLLVDEVTERPMAWARGRAGAADVDPAPELEVAVAGVELQREHPAGHATGDAQAAVPDLRDQDRVLRVEGPTRG